MDNELGRKIKEAMPTLPDALAEEWIAPYAEMLGPPQFSGRWIGILGGKRLDFWKDVSWDLEQVNLAEVINNGLELRCLNSLVEMQDGYFHNVANLYSRHIPDGKQRAERVLEYLREHRVLPVPPALLRLSDGKFNIIDGNHRALGYIQAMEAHPPEADEVQKVWIGRHKDDVEKQ